jgi:alkylated DNA repair dioxygenase AlkB
MLAMLSNELAHADADLIWQQCLFAFDEPEVAAPVDVNRTWLDDESWVDHLPRWMHGADLVFAELVARLPWRQRQVVMYDRLLPEPRLTAWWSEASGVDEPLPVLAEARQRLTRHYGRPFDSIGFNLYRDGHDSVAWHGDRERYLHEDPVVAIVSVGSPRPFQMRPRGGGGSTTWMLGQGDLLVMGGACQHQWEHAVPKVARTAGPRVSIMFRHNLSGVDYPDGAAAVAAEAARRGHPSAGARD